MNHEKHEKHEKKQGQAEHSFPFFLILFSVLFVSFVVYLLFFHRLANRDLWSSHEARAAMDAQTILDDGAWGLPHLYDGRPELQKPPLYYWLVAAVARYRGGIVDAWAVRLPASLAALGCVVLVFWLAWQRGRPVAGIIAATVLATAIHFTWLARVGRIDMPLTLAVGIILHGWFFAFRTSRSSSAIPSYQPGAPATEWRAPSLALRAGGSEIAARWIERADDPKNWRRESNRNPLYCLLLAYLALAAGLLLKGPIALVLPGAAFVVFLLVERNWRHPIQQVRHLGLWWGLPLALGFAGSWFIWADRATHDDLFRTFFLHHNLDRAFGENVVDRWSHPWWLYGPLFAANFLPWSVLVPVAAWTIWRKGWWREDQELRFGAAWFVAVLLVLSCVSFKRADYLLPAYPGAALFLGCVGERAYRAAVHRRRLANCFTGVALGTVIGWLVYLHGFLPAKDIQLECQTFAAEVRRRAPAPQQVSFFRTEAHALAFHVGRPLAIFVEWERLADLADRAESQYVVMPLARLAECADHVPVERFEKLATSNHPRPLVLLRTRPFPAGARADEPADAGTAAIAADRHAAAQRPAARAERSAGP
jgi:4-amino-4-deoxy-L-arabinose transferase-like glycosyltransferase